MYVENIFDTIFYPNLKSYVESNNIYNAKVVKVSPQDSKVFPIIPVGLLSVTNRYNNLNYGEETYSFGIEVNIYAVDFTQEITETNNGVTNVTYKKISKKSVCDDLTNLIVNYIKSTYHFTVKVTHDAPNVDDNIHRNIIRLTGVLDTKYGDDNLVIYPILY